MTDFLPSIDINKDNKIKIHFNQPSSYYVQHSVQSGRGKLSQDGALVLKLESLQAEQRMTSTSLKSAETSETVWWENNVNEMTV